MSTVFTGSIVNGLKLTLNKIVTDKKYGESQALFSKWLTVLKMSDNWEEDLEVGGAGLASEKPEGAEMATVSIREGYRTRYNARTFASKMVITEEAIDDNKYDKIIQAGQRLSRAMWKTIDIDATNILVRGHNTSFVGGDGLPLWSASHTIPGGGTFSNVMATPLSPSRAAVIVATTQIGLYPGHDGITEGYEPVCVVCPKDQWATWSGLISSPMDPTAGAFNEINVVNTDLNLKVVPNKYWNDTTTRWAFLTDADDGINFRFRKKPVSRDWVDEDQMLLKYGISARWSRGWSNPRCTLGVDA